MQIGTLYDISTAAHQASKYQLSESTMSAPKGFLSQHRTLYNLVKPTLPKAPSDTNYLYPLAPNLFYPPRGRKEVYLYISNHTSSLPQFSLSVSVNVQSADASPYHRPNFVLTFLRPHPDAPPNFASFLTPLNLNKLDLKDYLYNAYGIHVLSVRSYVQQQRVREGKPRSRWPQRNRYVMGFLHLCRIEGMCIVIEGRKKWTAEGGRVWIAFDLHD